MMRNRYIYDISLEEWNEGKTFMHCEIFGLGLKHPVRLLLRKAIVDFESGKFSYDGATFVKERSKSLFEVAAFIHDWRNAMGYVGKKIDQEMFDIMICLDYNLSLIKWRWILTQLTFLNIIRHRIMCSYLGANPDDLYLLK